MSLSLAEAMFGTPGNLARCVLLLLIALLLAAAVTDLIQRRIPNALIVPGSGLAVAAHVLLPPGNGFLSAMPGGLGMLPPLVALLFIVLLGLPLFRLRLVGAGDIKLLAVAAAFLGPHEILWALYFTVLSGGVLALLWLWRADAPHPPLAIQRPLAAPWRTQSLPYGLAIAFGCIATILYRGRIYGLF